ncbi:MAG: hypothetical protein BMS9Abin18_1385 [Zetaproteobacteria bacterium]|nr:MAG: hypothetical protein BMS9Abin18_1385 [Zetaproteobacteria bacterium]
MQRQLDRMRRRKRTRRRFLAIICISLLTALLVVAMRACSDGFNRPYNQGYQPMDEKRMQKGANQ